MGFPETPWVVGAKIRESVFIEETKYKGKKWEERRGLFLSKEAADVVLVVILRTSVPIANVIKKEHKTYFKRNNKIFISFLS